MADLVLFNDRVLLTLEHLLNIVELHDTRISAGADTDVRAAKQALSEARGALEEPAANGGVTPELGDPEPPPHRGRRDRDRD